MQEQLYKMKWTELRPIQAKSIPAILNGTGDLIISAMTAGGKTEAAFLPILSRLLANPGGLRALYVGPLKALINDQFRRLAELCELAEIPVHRWHGDVGASAKRDLIESPSGVLLITPESVESLFINRTKNLPRLFASLEFIVIDELHAFIGSERGAHLKSLVSRIVQICGSPPRLVGLSATLGDMALAAKWLCPRDPARVQIMTDDGKKTIRYRLKGYLRAKDGSETDGGPSDEGAVEEPAKTADDRRLAQDLIDTFGGQTSLIFANSRAQIEFYADLARIMLEERGLPNPFRVHHGSLSKAEREETEEALRSGRAASTFCSSTLELGIDVGNIAAVGQIGPPWSVGSLTQRMGRSGRRAGQAAVLIVFVQEEEPAGHGSLVHKLFTDTLQAVAMTELMLKKWSEPPQTGKLHLSTLIQQILSVITERGGIGAVNLFDLLVSKGAFLDVDRREFADVLKGLGAKDLIEQTPEGDLILGIAGERIVRSKDFYSAFASSEDMQVYFGGRLIGQVSAPPGIGGDGYLILAGRRWKVIEVDASKREILVEPAKGGRLPYFTGTSGADIHPKVRAEMLAQLRSESLPPYLDEKARSLLSDARGFAQQAGILASPIITDGSDTYWFTWTGSRANRTLMAMGKYFGDLDVRDDGVALSFARTPPEAVRDAYLGIMARPPGADTIAAQFPSPTSEKYDEFLTDELQARNFARNSLDVLAAIAKIESDFSAETTR